MNLWKLIHTFDKNEKEKFAKSNHKKSQRYEVLNLIIPVKQFGDSRLNRRTEEK